VRLCYVEGTPDETRRTGIKAKTTHRHRQPVSRKVPVMAWVLLVVAGLLEVGWSVGMKYTDGFTRPLPSVLTGAGIVASMLLLSQAAKTLPIGTAYGVWVGIGAAGAAVFGMAVLGEPATAARIFFVCLLLVAVVGLKATSGR
jgi:quaternary ammonium compound-resistance protein SugE